MDESDDALHEILNKKISRREALSVGAKIGIAAGIGLVVGFAGGYLGGVASAPQKTVTKTVTAPKFLTKQIAIGVTDKVTDLDPSNAYDFYTWEVLNNVMEGLVKYKQGTLEIIPALAESWETEDAKNWTFHLRKDLKFADGTPLTAKDVVRSVNRIIKISGDPSWLVKSFVESVEAPDDYTVVFHLKSPVAYFLSLLITPPYFPVSPKYKPEEIDSDQTAGGDGPYMISEFVRDEVLSLKANPNYYGESPYTENVIVKFYRDASTMRLALENGEIDIAWRTLRPTDIEYFKKSGNFKVVEIPGSFIRYVCLSMKLDPTKNKLVRQALAAAVNRSEITELVFRGTVSHLYSMVPNGMWSHKDVFKKYGDANLEMAKSLLEEAGYSEANPVEIELWYTPTHYGDTEADLAQVLKSEWEATGVIKVDVKSAEWGTYVDYARKGRMMVYLLGWYPDYLDPDDYTTPFLHSEANAWTGTYYSNPEVDELLTEAQSVVDQSKRAKIYEQVQDILAEDVPYIPLIQGKLFMVTRPEVKGIIVGPDMLVHYNSIYKAPS
ncbi:MAG: peptide ABC transporter substrate-binding protein [Thaumarchaeota archaeon]|nr:peptide ABC transporter substrate-binding protein [Nitrososphaerota archaeon]